MSGIVTIGLTTWREHPALIGGQNRPVKLSEYAAWFPTVEVDTFFYALPRLETVANWLGNVASGFQFIVKAHSTMTLHDRGTARDAGDLPSTFAEFRRVVAPLVAANQLKAVLFQVPPYFGPDVKNIEYLHEIRNLLPHLPLAIELRNRRWFTKAVMPSLVRYCQDLGMTLVAADEPNTGVSTVPFRLFITNPNLVMLRLHGRNAKGWAQQGPDWRKKRTLYRYSDDELHQFADMVDKARKQAKEVCVIFNNNSAKDAAPNALTLQKMMGLHFNGLNQRPPEQLDLF